MVYEPAEDSWLLADVVKQFARGRTIDVGTGTGIQALAALQQTPDVSAVDCDMLAVKSAQQAGITAIQSDLFENVNGTFDTIICNTPYLPSTGSQEVALDGGKKGFEWTLRFLDKATVHLKRSGQILFLISSLTNPGVIEDYMRKHCLEFTVLARKVLFFEELLVYQATFALPNVPDATFVARGKRSTVYRTKNIAIKVSDPAIAAREATMLQAANKLSIGPMFKRVEGGAVWMDFVDGIPIGVWLKTATPAQKQQVFEHCKNQCLAMDTAGIDKRELTNPYKHIIITKKGPVMIDFERARFSEKPHCVAQFTEYARRTGVPLV